MQIALCLFSKRTQATCAPKSFLTGTGRKNNHAGEIRIEKVGTRERMRKVQSKIARVPPSFHCSTIVTGFRCVCVCIYVNPGQVNIYIYIYIYIFVNTRKIYRSYIAVQNSNSEQHRAKWWRTSDIYVYIYICILLQHYPVRIQTGSLYGDCKTKTFAIG